MREHLVMNNVLIAALKKEHNERHKFKNMNILTIVSDSEIVNYSNTNMNLNYSTHFHDLVGECLVLKLDDKQTKFSVTSFNENIYVAGGFNSSNELMNRFQVFDFFKKKWNKLEPTKAGGALAMTVFRDSIFVAGGNVYSENGFDFLDLFYRYDINMRRWFNLSKMNCCRSNFSLINVGEYIYAIGKYFTSLITSLI
jgi:hypothetical protein